MPGEVVRAELVFRVKAFGLKIFGPFLQLRPVKSGKIRVALHLCDSSHQEEQVARFLDLTGDAQADIAGAHHDDPLGADVLPAEDADAAVQVQQQA